MNQFLTFDLIQDVAETKPCDKKSKSFQYETSEFENRFGYNQR